MIYWLEVNSIANKRLKNCTGNVEYNIKVKEKTENLKVQKTKKRPKHCKYIYPQDSVLQDCSTKETKRGTYILRREIKI